MIVKRKALLIGYDASDDHNASKLNGVPIDLINYKSYLQSYKGGAWENNEIEMLLNPKYDELINVILKIKLAQTDVVFCVFSGHGEFSEFDKCRRVQINKDKTILEKELWNIAPKQILILDSCSGISSNKKNISESSESFLGFMTTDSLKNLYRNRYESECFLCEPQLLRFYAAIPGQYANDTDYGGEYSKTLINVLEDSNNISIVDAHNKARDVVITETNGKQTPDKNVPKIRKYLPGAIVL